MWAYAFVIGVLVGLFEPVHPTGFEWALIASDALFPFLLLATGIVSLRCRTKRRLWALGALAAAAAANLAVSTILYPQATRSACLQYLAKQRELAPPDPIDTSCLAES